MCHGRLDEEYKMRHVGCQKEQQVCEKAHNWLVVHEFIGKNNTNYAQGQQTDDVN